MKTVIIISFLLCWNSFSEIQSKNINKGPNGTYICTSVAYPWVLHVDGGRFEMLEARIRRTPEHTFNDTIAIGRIKYESKNIIKLSSINIYDNLLNSVKLNEYYDADIQDQIKIKFIAGDSYDNKIRLWPQYKIELLAEYRDYSFFSLTSDSIYIPSRIDGALTSVQFSIASDNEASGFSYIDMGIQLSPTVVRFQWNDGFKIQDPKNNVIEISISPIYLYNVFDRFYIKNEYCKVSPNSITWRDKVFRKISDKIIDLETLKKKYN